MKHRRFLPWLTMALACALLVGFGRGSAKPPADSPLCAKATGSLPHPARPAGSHDPAIPIDHIIVIMQENHSFDQYFGRLNQKQYYGDQIDGVLPEMSNRDASGQRHFAYHETNRAIPDTDHSWNAEHRAWNDGRNDGFVRWTAVKGDLGRVMGYYDQTELPYYYGLASEFAVADRYFCSSLTMTYPNRFYLMAGTSFGHVKNDDPKHWWQFSQKTIFDVLDQYGVSWKYYTDDVGYLQLFKPLYRRDRVKTAKLAQYDADLAADRLPQVTFIDANFEGEDEHPDADVQIGQAWVEARVNSLMKSKAWASSALLLTYDENGGFFDHVPPPPACAPDGMEPDLYSDSSPGRFDRYGFRVPFIAVSPFAKRHYVSHRTYDHTSILKFIETRFNLPALTRRDANAEDLTDLFDFSGYSRPATP